MAKYVGLGITPLDKAVAIIPGEPIARDTNNDLSVDETGNLRLVYDAEAIGEHARQRLLFYRGEWFLDPTIGVDWYGQVLGYSESRTQVAEGIVKQTILRTPGVTGLNSIDTEFRRGARGVVVRSVSVQTEFDEDTAVA